MDRFQLLPNLAKDLEFWMTALPPRLRSIPIIHLAIPGSHDSMTFGMTKNSAISPDARPPVQKLRFLGPLARPALVRWSKTQEVDVEEQLKGGVRYFDLRIAFKRNVRQFCFVHNLYSDPVEPIFEQIYQFLDSHPNEVVILDCQHFFNMTKDDHFHFSHYLKMKFNFKLMPYPDAVSRVTLDSMAAGNRQIILVYRWDLPNEMILWPGTEYHTPWPDTIYPHRLFDFLDQGLKNRNSTVGFVSQCVLTPTFKYACQNFCHGLKLCCFLNMELIKRLWLRDHKPGDGGLNVVISDFVDFENYHFCKEVINLNFKLLDDCELNM